MHEEARLLANQLGKHGQLTIHVDDIAVTVEGDTPTEAVDRLHQASQALVRGFEVELELPFDKDKAFLVANSKLTLTRTATKLGTYAGQQAEEIRRLGVDHSLTGKTRHHTWKARFAKNLKRKQG